MAKVIHHLSTVPVSGQAATHPPDNAEVARMLREMADLLEAQGDSNLYRCAAYRRAAETVERCELSMGEIIDSGGRDGLDALPGIGRGIAAAIFEFMQTGHWTRLERLRGTADAEAVLRSVPGIGTQLATRLHDELGVDTLEGLEQAAHEGQLERMPLLGARRAAAIRAALAQMLDGDRARRRLRAPRTTPAQVPIDLLLDVDREYQDAAMADRLPKINTRRFNPEGRPWLPVLHTRRDAWSFTALYSNTARAHELERVHDWVVLYAEDAARREAQYTVVTAQAGLLAGRRVVRGREEECRAYYAQHGMLPAAAPQAIRGKGLH